MCPLFPIPVTISRPRAAAHRSSATPKAPSRVPESCSRPRISARMTRRATARSRTRPLAFSRSPTLPNTASSPASMASCAKTTPPTITLVREDVLLRPALQIKERTRRQEIKAAARQFGAALARQHHIEPSSQCVEMQDVGGGIAQLLLAQRCRAPIRALLLLFQVDPEEVLAQVPQAVPVGECPHEPRGDLRAVERLRHDAEIVVEDRDVEPREMEELDDARIGQQPLQVRRLVTPGGELHEVRVAIAARQLNEAQAVAMRV